VQGYNPDSDKDIFATSLALLR